MTTPVHESQVACACGCGTLIAARGSNGRPRRFVSGHHARVQVVTQQKRERVAAARRAKFIADYPEGTKTCPRCEQNLDLDEFFFGGKRREMCQSCNREDSRQRQRARYQDDPKRYFMSRYGMSEEEYERLAKQMFCGICGELAEVFDHDHDTGRMRDRLCHRCNLGLGSFADDPDRLRQAAEYIERHARQDANV